jgi:hypothetical protein
MQTRQKPDFEPLVPMMLNDNRVTRSFREALFEAADRHGLTVSEFALRAAAEKLQASGRQFTGVFRVNDIPETAR